MVLKQLEQDKTKAGAVQNRAEPSQTEPNRTEPSRKRNKIERNKNKVK